MTGIARTVQAWLEGGARVPEPDNKRMRASELVAAVQALIDKHGDLEIEGTFEGVFRQPAVYRAQLDARSGEVDERVVFLIDVDGELDRRIYEHPEDRT